MSQPGCRTGEPPPTGTRSCWFQLPLATGVGPQLGSSSTGRESVGARALGSWVSLSLSSGADSVATEMARGQGFAPGVARGTARLAEQLLLLLPGPEERGGV